MAQGQEDRHLYLIMTENEHQYGLYRIEESQLAADESTIRNLGNPLLLMDRSTFPRLMAFGGVDSSIFMVGGIKYDEENRIYNASKKVFIFDTKSSTLVAGPELNSPKSNPHLITLGSKIFVLSDIISSDNLTSLDWEPRFEMLDTLHLEYGWLPLPLPQLYVATTTRETVFSVDALAAVAGGNGNCSGDIVVLSTSGAGTYAFDVDNQTWEYVMNDSLPFEGAATTLPHNPSMCCAYSLRSDKFSNFLFSYGGDEGNRSFHVEEIIIDDTHTDSSPLPPEICYRPRKTIAGPHGIMYFIDSGIDGELGYTLSGDRYVKVSAMQLSNMKKTTKRWGKPMGSCGTKDRTLGVGLDKAGSSKRSRKGRVQEKETNELMLTSIWRRSFFGGPICDPFLHVVAAFAM